jgi:hypothetical protein
MNSTRHTTQALKLQTINSNKFVKTSDHTLLTKTKRSSPWFILINAPMVGHAGIFKALIDTMIYLPGSSRLVAALRVARASNLICCIFYNTVVTTVSNTPRTCVCIVVLASKVNLILQLCQ